MLLRIVLIIGILTVIGILGSEIRAWRAGTSVLTSGQKALRISSATLMIAVMSMVLAGDTWLTPFGPVAKMAYWTVCFGLAVSLVIFALLDLREIGLLYGERRKRIFRDFRKSVDDKNHSAWFRRN